MSKTRNRVNFEEECEAWPRISKLFQNRKMSVKWYGCRSVPRNINGGGPKGATLSILDQVNEEDRFKFIDALS